MNKNRDFDQKKYTQNYNATHYKRLQTDISIDDYIYIDNFCKDMHISKAALIVTACRDYIGRTGYNDYNKMD